MHRALQLAKRGFGNVSPNPLVGCVIVHENKIIGEGYHRKYGEGHAEVNAVDSVENKDLLKESTVYVTLEPCSHYGKTPPCCDLLIDHDVKKVVVAAIDPHHKVAGKGLEKMKNAGIEVEVGMLKKESERLNKRFNTFHIHKRPYIILKWAQTKDHFIARENFDSKWISNENSRQLVHKWRCEEDAIMVGKNTAIYDDPSLTARSWTGSNPTRVLLDTNLEVGNHTNLFNEEASTLIFNSKKDEEKGQNKWVKLDDFSCKEIIDKVYQQNIQSIIIEGGATVLNSFITENCWDEARIFKSDKIFNKGIKAPIIEGAKVSEEEVFGDQLEYYTNE